MGLLDFSLPGSDPNNPNSTITSAADYQQRLALAQALMKQGMDYSPVQSPWQGAARMAQALMGGLEAHDLQQQASAGQKGVNDSLAAALGGGAAAPASPAASPSAGASAAPAAAAPDGSGGQSLPTFAGAQGANPTVSPAALAAGLSAGSDPMGVAPYIQQAAAKYGIDPATALKVARSEGLGVYTGDGGSSFGPFQLHYGNVAGGGNAVGGMGDDFTKATGLDARDPSTVKAQIDFALANAAKNGWGAWHGAGKVGVGAWDGIGGAPQGGAASASPTQVAALGPLAGVGGGGAVPMPGGGVAASVNPVTGNPLPGSAPAAAPAAAGAQAIAVPGYDGKFTRAQANDGDGVPSQAEWDAAAKSAGAGTPAQAPLSATNAPAASASPPSGAPAAARPQIDPKALMAVLSNPFATPAQQQIASALLQNQLKDHTPVSVAAGSSLIDPSTGRVVYTAPVGSDKSPTSVQEYEYAKKGGYTGSFTDYQQARNAKAMDESPKVVPSGGAVYDPKQGKTVYENHGAGGTFDDATVSGLADRVIAGESGVLTGLGRGAQGAENIGKVQAAITQKMAAAGASPDTIAKAKSEVAGKMQEQRTLGSASASNTLYGNTAAAAMDTALKASAAVPRSNWKPLNQLMQMGQKAWSDPDYGAFLAANNTLVTEYAKATSPVGAPTDSQRAHAYELLGTADGPEKYDRVVRMMHQEIENTHRAIGDSKQQLKSGAADLRPLQTPTLPGSTPAPMTAVNPKTGEKLQLDPTGTKWVPVQ